MNEFGREGGAGERLQQALLEKTKNNGSWVGAGEQIRKQDDGGRKG